MVKPVSAFNMDLHNVRFLKSYYIIIYGGKLNAMDYFYIARDTLGFRNCIKLSGRLYTHNSDNSHYCNNHKLH